jgi:hypothetical protein
VLRELTISGLNNTGDDGIAIVSADNVYIERCAIAGFAGAGIEYTANGRLFISETDVRDNGGSGLTVNSPGSTPRVNVYRSRFERNTINGVDLSEGGIEAVFTKCQMSENGNDGLGIDSAEVSRVQVGWTTASNNGSNGFLVTGSGASQLNIEWSTSRGNTNAGMRASGGATMRVSNSASTNNSTGFENSGGTFESRGNNTVRGNVTDTSGVISVIPGT